MEIDDADFDQMQHLNDGFIEAVAGGDVLEAEKYLNAGVSVDVYGGHALSLALQYGEFEMFKMLLRRGAELNNKDILKALLDREENSAAFLKEALARGLDVEKLLAVMPSLIITVDRFEEIDLLASHIKDEDKRQDFIEAIYKQALQKNFVQVLTHMDQKYPAEGAAFCKKYGGRELKDAIAKDNGFVVKYLLEKAVPVTADEAVLALEEQNIEIFNLLASAMATIDEGTREVFFYTALYYGVFEVARQFKSTAEQDKNIAIKTAYDLLCQDQFRLFETLLTEEVVKAAELPPRLMMDAVLFSGKPARALKILQRLIDEGLDPYAREVTALRMAEKLGRSDFVTVVKDAVAAREDKSFKRDFGEDFTLNDLRYTYDERGYNGLARAVLMGRLDEVLKCANAKDGDVLTIDDLLAPQNDEPLLDMMRRHGAMDAVLLPNLWQDDSHVRAEVMVHLRERQGSLAFDAFQNYHSIEQMRKVAPKPFIFKRGSSQPKQ